LLAQAMKAMNKTRKIAFASLLVFVTIGVPVLLFVLPCLAQSVTTTITSSGLGTEVVLPQVGNNLYNINGGTPTSGAHGNNLFHSFGEFSVGSGDIARFNNTTALTHIDNVLSQVTGNDPSIIFGTIQSTMNGAHFYFINPNGVVFGPNASLQVSGSVHFSTANLTSRFQMA
jgi:filamentous hemagglutinin family protein